MARECPSLPPVLITGHYDVVPVIPGTETKWEQPPYDGVMADGVIWGRGAPDDKSAVAAARSGDRIAANRIQTQTDDLLQLRP